MSSVFARRDFRFLLFGQTTSQLGAQVSSIAIPLLAVLTLHASSLQLGLVNAAGTVAFAIVGLPAGAWIDQWRRRSILIAADVARAAFLSSLPAAWLLGVLTLPQLIVVSLLAGVARVFFDVGYQSYLPTVIGKDAVLAGNSAMETIRASGQVIGPGLGGWLVALAGAANVVMIQAGTFAVSAGTLLAIRTREPEPSPRAAHPQLRVRIGEGLRFVATHRVLRATAITSATGNLAFAIASPVSMLFLARTLGLSARQIGGVVAIGSLASMAGAVLAPRLARRIGSARVIWLPLAVTGPLTLVGPLAQPGPLVVLALIGTAAGEVGQIIYAITNVSLRQQLCPEHMLGRVNATMRFLIMGLFPLGALIGGALGELIGIRATLWLSFGLISISPAPTYGILRHARDLQDCGIRR